MVCGLSRHLHRGAGSSQQALRRMQVAMSSQQKFKSCSSRIRNATALESLDCIDQISLNVRRFVSVFTEPDSMVLQSAAPQHTHCSVLIATWARQARSFAFLVEPRPAPAVTYGPGVPRINVAGVRMRPVLGGSVVPRAVSLLQQLSI